VTSRVTTNTLTQPLWLLRAPLGAWADMSDIHTLLTLIGRDSSAPPFVVTPMTMTDSGSVVHRVDAPFSLCEELELGVNASIHQIAE
jgi:hypothetical protein